LKAGKSQIVQIPLPADVFTVVDEDGRRVIDGKQFTFYVGTAQPDEKSFALTGVRPMEVLWRL